MVIQHRKVIERGRWQKNTVCRYAIGRQVASLLGLREELGGDEVVELGETEGGSVAVEMIRMCPTRGRAGIPCNTKATADTPEAKLGRDSMAAKAEREGPG